ncbi:hypothetical protein HHE03_18220 [Helicobacter heilmannii]|uniref:hypothetical protein n=1 Tax=Helicobacter heilmannii TaxID=35817 RepID=UPI0006A0CD9C|nr:hypothetical protein [Helicobacter heilmannii]CRF50118.1 hypothetical protein HHE03_18220 [Helicobacter heilmannii]
MFSVNSALNVIRSRLKDQNYRDLRFSDAEILDAINTIAAQLIVEFKLNKAQQTRQIGPNNRFIQCPYLLCVLEAKFNNAILYNRTDLDNATEVSLLVQGSRLGVSPASMGTLSVVYCAYEPLSDVAEFLPLPPIASQAVVYGVLSLLLEIPTDEQNYQKIGILKNLYHEAKNLLAMHLNSLFSRAQNCQSKVVRV